MIVQRLPWLSILSKLASVMLPYDVVFCSTFQAKIGRILLIASSFMLLLQFLKIDHCSAGVVGDLGALFQGQNVRPLLIGSSLMLFQQITGQPSVLYYAAKIFKDAGFASDQDATRVSVVLGFFKLVMTGLTATMKWAS